MENSTVDDFTGDVFLNLWSQDEPEDYISYEILQPMELVLPSEYFSQPDQLLTVGEAFEDEENRSNSNGAEIFSLQALEESVAAEPLNLWDAPSLVDPGLDLNISNEVDFVEPVMIPEEASSYNDNSNNPGEEPVVNLATANDAAVTPGCSDSAKKSSGPGKESRQKVFLYQIDETKVKDKLLAKRIKKAKRCKAGNEYLKAQADIDIGLVRQSNGLADELIAYIGEIKAEPNQEKKNQMWNGELREMFKQFEGLYNAMKASRSLNQPE